MYQLFKHPINNNICSVSNSKTDSSVPFDPDNTDYQQFKKDLLTGTTLNDAENNAMTAEQITAFLETIP